MKLSEVKKALESVNEIKFELPNGSFVPVHFHVTEVGSITSLSDISQSLVIIAL